MKDNPFSNVPDACGKESKTMESVTFDPSALRMSDDELGEKISTMVGAFVDANTPYLEPLAGIFTMGSPEPADKQAALRVAHEARQSEARAKFGKAFREVMAEMLRDVRVVRFEFASDEVKPEHQR